MKAAKRVCDTKSFAGNPNSTMACRTRPNSSCPCATRKMHEASNVPIVRITWWGQCVLNNTAIKA
eukprot:2303591-Amphidinium_carterae.2